MALTNFFYWMLAYGAPVEKIGAVSASEDIFVQICARVAPALQKHYGLSSAEIEFFSAHEAIGEALNPLDEQILVRFDNPLDRQRLTRAVRLSHDYELMFYDTVLDHNP
jgi:pyrroloquinoline-quinone synthase